MNPTAAYPGISSRLLSDGTLSARIFPYPGLAVAFPTFESEVFENLLRCHIYLIDTEKLNVVSC
jgi:hypothetical protein